MRTKPYIGYAALIALLSLLSLQIDTSLSLSEQWQLFTQPESASEFRDVFFMQSQLPRLSITLLVGAMLGLTGSLMQQLTQNNLTSPLTLGTSSGAWLALVIVNIWFVDWVADYSAFAAMAGALVAFGLIISIAGVRNMTGLPLVVSGMVINILLGSIATALIILHAQFAQNIFMWGAGDLSQYSWDWFEWLLPRSTVAIVILIVAPRILTLMKLGQEGAAARGLAVLPAFGALMVMGIWLVSASITAVGIISFIGLLTPNIARAMGARTPRDELISSMLLGAALLLITDSAAIYLSLLLEETIPSGVAAAAIGAPALIWFTRKKLTATDQLNLSMSQGKTALSNAAVWGIAVMGIIGILAYSFVTHGISGIEFAIPGEFQWQLRWPRMISAISVGVALSVAGIILQRIVYNPLASPDILGVSSGATFAIIITGVMVGSVLAAFNWGVAFLGSLTVLMLLLIIGKRSHFNPSNFVLSGIALSALLQALVQFALAQGSGESYKILLWLTGSTYRVTSTSALVLLISVLVLLAIVLALSRWLTLISIGRAFSNARGLNPSSANTILLVIVALLCAFSTATVGPVSFVGLVAPHMAMMLGARKVKEQLFVGSLIGATLMVWADWLGQIAIYPSQIAAGTLVAIIGSTYFLFLMLKSKFR
ncbi:TPA: Fe(3+)-hydroxamate ABC transporter permease FhuB [Vibrio parahaemolyticus]|uniref:Fe(3+)-hydroxamate ABC transporter permease FhuB n=1 Tax=Vibrio parahaemolyticus TaxID=670 RepID=UPI00084A7242|nr:Fe(3+)-hydroxamate ABC transporter permease FhuB [Vibrio parahaemolyticus]EHR6401162.1 Fe(3+)-hydroxamate ABC transporter permease FhuB [Vibrio parahaemolyticus]ODY27351.1 Fe3+-hydroxamate ABC transporter permease FhuB [Vibrio parahaemolyticus]OEA70963.1 Fe3+-hydroxamate ABC transporter permease FhuB [Vibrio parahaemolyticus]OEA79167.1 Fe3+-hydroxamate ABC transporter permease FhuB [Vibrio parahaemolyticus]HAS6833092.1 Fe(3+)-hydroxamate ABC transporter permease FhuB [Vibrio parahaemolyticu